MKFSTAAASAALLSTANTSMMTNAFLTPSPSSSFTQQQQTSQTRLSLLPDPFMAASAIQSTSVITADMGIIEGLGQLALIGSVGLGVAYSNTNNKDWSYEYKVGNELSDLAVLGESATSVMEKAEEKVEKKEEAVKEEPVAVAEEVVAEPKKTAAAPPPVAKPPAPVKANKPSKELLESAEKAKAAVQKKGVQETKDKMSSKATPPAPVTEKKAEAASSTDVAETKKPGGKRRFAKGLTLIAAAGALALARNVVKAYLGRGML